MNNVMIDLETMGTSQSAPIISIGAVFFHPDHQNQGLTFYCNVSLESNMRAGRMPDADTILWWMEQSDEARAAITQPGPSVPVLDLGNALESFANFLRLAYTIPNDYLRVWGNGATFDIAMLENAYRGQDIPIPWKFYNVRDVRTLTDLDAGDAKRTTPFIGDKHTALADAQHQARYVTATLAKIEVKQP